MPRKIKLIWSDRAKTEVLAAATYIKTDKPMAAEKFVERIVKVTRRLETFPLSGRLIPELPNAPYRELIIEGYRIIYEYQEKAAVILILSVLSGRQSLPFQ